MLPNSFWCVSKRLSTVEVSVFWGSVRCVCWYKLFFLWSCHPSANTFSCLQWNVLRVHLHLLSVFSITLRDVHTVWFYPAAAFSSQRSLAGLPGRSLLVVRKLALIGLVTTRSPKLVPPRHLPSWAPLNKKTERKKKKKKSLFNSCTSSQAGIQAGRQTDSGGGRGTKESTCKTGRTFENWNLRIGLLLKVLNQLNIKYKPMQC